MDAITYVTRRRADLEYKLAISSEKPDSFHRMCKDDGAWSNVHDCLLSLLSPGDTLLDIGANIGTVSIPLAAKGVRVIAYEALQENVRYLEAAVRENRFEDRITIRNVAVWETNARLAFAGHGAWVRVVPCQAGSCEAVVIDADIHPDTKVAAVKFDVEGSELHVLRGMLDLLRSQRPHVVLESNIMNLARLGSSATMLLPCCDDTVIYRIHRSRRLMRPGRWPQEACVCDLLASRFGSWRLRWTTGNRVGSLRPRHYIRRIVETVDAIWQRNAKCLPSLIDSPPRSRKIGGSLFYWTAGVNGTATIRTSAPSGKVSLPRRCFRLGQRSNPNDPADNPPNLEE